MKDQIQTLKDEINILKGEITKKDKNIEDLTFLKFFMDKSDPENSFKLNLWNSTIIEIFSERKFH